MLAPAESFEHWAAEAKAGLAKMRRYVIAFPIDEADRKTCQSVLQTVDTALNLAAEADPHNQRQLAYLFGAAFGGLNFVGEILNGHEVDHDDEICSQVRKTAQQLIERTRNVH